MQREDGLIAERSSLPPSSARAERRTRRTRAILIGVAVLALLIAFAIALFDWNLLRAPISRYVSGKLDRTFVIAGDLKVKLSLTPLIEVNRVSLANAPWGSEASMAEAERAVFRVELMPLLHGKVVIPEVALTKPSLLLERDKDGNANWDFGRPDAKPARMDPPEIGSLRIDEGKVQVRDAGLQAQVALLIQSDAAASDPAKPQTDTVPRAGGIRFKGEGSMRKETVEIQGHAGEPLSLQQAGTPYELSVKASAGRSNASFKGTLVPLKLDSIDGTLEASGDDLSQLYPLVPVPLPWTPAYKISGHLTRAGDKWNFGDVKGKVGNSDVAGTAALDVGGERPKVSADVTSTRLDYKDLAGFLGAPPPVKAGNTRTPEQQKEAVRRAATERVLPSKEYDLKKLRAADVDFKFRGKSVIASGFPLDDMSVHLKLKDGELKLAPLDFGVAGGNVVATVTLDARKPVIHSAADVTVRNVDLSKLLPILKANEQSAGKVGGRAKLVATGNSVQQMAASADGELALIMREGRLSTLSLFLANLDLANAARMLVRGDQNAPVHCMVASTTVRDGWLNSNFLVVDSTEELITGEGGIDLREERYKLRIKADSKRASLLALRGPIRVGGTFKHPEVTPEVAPLAVRAGAAIALGALLTPPAALLALIDPGGAKDSDCAALVARAQQDVERGAGARASPVAPATKPSPRPNPSR